MTDLDENWDDFMKNETKYLQKKSRLYLRVPYIFRHPIYGDIAGGFQKLQIGHETGEDCQIACRMKLVPFPRTFF